MKREDVKEMIDDYDFLDWQMEIINECIDKIYNDHEAQLKDKDDEIRRLNNLYADTIKDLGGALIEIERLKEHITHLQKCLYET